MITKTYVCDSCGNENSGPCLPTSWMRIDSDVVNVYAQPRTVIFCPTCRARITKLFNKFAADATGVPEVKS